MYIVMVDNDAVDMTAEQVKSHFEAGNLRLVHGHGEGHCMTHVAIVGDDDLDTRGECQSVWDEVWMRHPKSLQQALHYSRT